MHEGKAQRQRKRRQEETHHEAGEKQKLIQQKHTYGNDGSKLLRKTQEGETRAEEIFSGWSKTMQRKRKKRKNILCGESEAEEKQKEQYERTHKL